MRSIYDALGKSVGKVKKSSRNPVKKVKVHITVSKDKHTKKTPGHSVVPRREVAVGAENEMGGTEKQLEQLQLREERHEAIRKSKKRKEKEEKHSIAQVLNNDLSKTPLHSAKCKSCRSAEDKPDNSRRSTGLSSKNSNLLADKPNFPTRKETRPGGCIDDTKMAILSQDIWRMAENKSNSRSQRRNSQRKAICSGHTSPGERISGHISCVTHIPADTTPVAVPVLMKDIPLEPSYAYHTEDNNYLYVHAAPRQPPFEERRSGRRRKSKQRKLRDISDDSDGMPRAFPGSTPVVHRHEHVHHHYHHYGEKPS